MKSSKTTRRALLGSLTSLVLCFAMLIGSTFAWFTDSASTSVNTIQAGKLDVQLLDANGGSLEGTTLSWQKAEGHENDPVLWEPGCTYKLQTITIKNNGDLALKYKVAITGINGSAKLNEVIDWTISNSGTLLAGSSDEYTLSAGGSNTLTISGTMQTTAGNEYQGLTIDGIAITVYATQLAEEYDSVNNTYDQGAEYLIPWDGSGEDNTTVPEASQDGKVHLSTAADLMALMNNTQSTNSYLIGQTIVLDRSIDLGGRTIKGFGSDSSNISFIFDGQGNTISNFKIDNSREWYSGLFNQVSHGGTVKNLKVKDATVIGNRMVGVIASSADSGTIQDCEVIDCTVISNMKKAGAIIGYTSNGTVTGCKATNVNVFCADSDTAESNEIVGYVNSGSTVSGNTATNVNVYRGATNVAAVSNATELKAAFTAMTSQVGSTTVVLTSDIDMAGYTSYGANYKTITIIGNGHTLKNQTKPLFNRAAPGSITVSDVTFKNANINENYDRDSWNASDGARAAGIVIGEFDNNGGGTIKIENCKVVDSTIKAWQWAGAFVGFTNGNQSTNESWVKFENCSVTNTTVSTKDSSAGGLIGHTCVDTTITNCTVSGNSSVSCAEDRNGSAAKAGWFVGTVNGGTTQFSGTNSVNVNTGCELGNVNAAAPLNDGFVGRTAASGNVTVN